jgi:hypothetical protein
MNHDAVIEDEVIRAKVRRLIDEKRPESRLAAFARHPLVLSLVGFLLTWGVGTLLTDNIKAGQLERDRALEADRARRTASIQAVNVLSSLIYDRRTRAELVLSAARRGAAPQELAARKAAYDSAYVTWNKNLQATLLGVRDIVGEKEYTDFESYVEFGLTPWFRDLDRLVTEAYDRRIGANVGPDSTAREEARHDLQSSLDCAYTITNALWIIAATSPRDTASMAATRARTAQELEQRCPRQ